MKAIDVLTRRGRRYDNLRRIERLDPAVPAECDEILGLVAYHEFPFEYVQGTSIAFMRDYGVPTISDLLDRTGRFRDDGQKRYDDTSLIGFEAAVDGIDSARAHAAVRRMNQIHSSYGIPNHEFRYVLATTLVGPKRFIDAYGYRPLHPHEIAAMTRFTTRFGELAGIKDLPSTYEEYERLLDDYEAEHFAYAPANTRVAEASMKIVTDWYPPFARPFARRALIAMLDEPLRVALGLPRQPRWLTAAMDGLLRLRGRLMRHLPPRRADDGYAHDASRTYPFGYKIADLGPLTHSTEVHAHAPAEAAGTTALQYRTSEGA
ncbi:oxygenase MpaB family protein [Marmoricola sp. RAF53]|uniref:oxygenase MpaB family protein n=1 Tax=Marmoricola sp. RAF53 TaxID=3233059 RepID=UPI003F9E83BA